MVGLAGVYGDTEPIDTLSRALRWRDSEVSKTYLSDEIRVGVSLHEPFSEEQPARAGEGVLVWIWGELYGFEDEHGYASRHESHPHATRSQYAARLYEDHGHEFVGGLNGEFTGVLYDEEADELSLFTDRLGSRGLFYTRTTAGGVVFSTKLQSLPLYPNVETDFSLDYLYEYFATDRSLGTKTPLEDVEKVPPATVLTFDGSGDGSKWNYWSPQYETTDRSLESIVDEFTETFLDVMEERTADDVDYGLLLSGGSDSRLVVAGTDEPMRCYTMAGWMSREARIAERVALSSGLEFDLLRRGREYQIEALDRNPELSNFVGRFQHAHATGFAETLTEDVDVLMSGQFCDTFFKGHFLPIPELPVDQISTIDIPVEKRIETIVAYIDRITETSSLPEYLHQPPTLDGILRRNIKEGTDGVTSHGVDYSSIRELVLCSEYYPLTNQPDSFFYDSMVQMMPYRSPFIDNRLIDLHLTIPVRYFLRRNIVNRAVKQLSPALARIPHAGTGVPLEYPFPAQYLGQKLSTVKRRFLPVDRPPASHLRQTSWTDHKTLIRETGFIGERLKAHESVLRDCSFIDVDDVWEVYRSHMDGDQRMPELYSLVTFLEMPVTKGLLHPDDADA